MRTNSDEKYPYPPELKSIDAVLMAWKNKMIGMLLAKMALMQLCGQTERVAEAMLETNGARGQK